MKILGMVTLYYPPEDFQERILSYVDGLDGLFVWDNTDPLYGERQFEKEINRKIVHLRTGANVGIGEALNAAVAYARQHNYSHLLTMDQDSTFLPLAFAKYIQCVAQDPDASHLAYVPLINRDCPSDAEPREVPDMIISGTLFPLQTFTKVGLFNAKFVIDAIDVEFVLRIQRLKGKIIQIPTVGMKHELGNPLTKRFLCWHPQSLNYPPVRTYYISRNFCYLRRQYPEYRKSTAVWRFIRKRPFYIIGMEKDKWKKLKAYFTGLLQGYRSDLDHDRYDKKLHPQTLIFRTGIDSGFFAEYTYLINALLYCRQHRKQFKLYSAGANFGYDKGWNDYFLPFCEEVTEPFHSRYNIHEVPDWKRIIAHCLQEKSLGWMKWKLKAMLTHRKGLRLARKAYGEKVLLNYDVKFKPDGNYMRDFNRMVDLTFRLNEETTRQCQELIDVLELPSNYIGCQVRGGDKVKEAQLLSPEHYLKLMKGRIDGKTVFVLTDDYSIFLKLQELAPNTTWRTLCTPEERGYVNSDFTRTDSRTKEKQMIRFLASMQVLMKASFFVGSITTGPSLFLLKKLYPHVCPADCTLENLKEVITLPIAERSLITQKYES